MKKVLIIFLSILLLLQSGGLFVSLNFNQLLVKIAQNGLKYTSENTLTLSLTPDEYKRCKLNKREILYQEKMYDIVSENAEKNCIILKVVQDNFEIEIANFIKKYLSKNKKSDDNIALSSLMHLCYLQSYNLFMFKSEILVETTKGYIQKNISDYLLKIELPPPELRQLFY